MILERKESWTVSHAEALCAALGWMDCGPGEETTSSTVAPFGPLHVQCLLAIVVPCLALSPTIAQMVRNLLQLVRAVIRGNHRVEIFMAVTELVRKGTHSTRPRPRRGGNRSGSVVGLEIVSAP